MNYNISDVWKGDNDTSKLVWHRKLVQASDIPKREIRYF
jgi:hypothetical protein